jgi:hypothetical protein
MLRFSPCGIHFFETLNDEMISIPYGIFERRAADSYAGSVPPFSNPAKKVPKPPYLPLSVHPK